MRERDLDRMLDLVEDQYLTASQDAARRLEQNPPIHWKRWAALAACAAIVVAGAFRLLGNGSLSMGGTGSREEHVSGDVFDYYAGPVLPLTLAEPAEPGRCRSTDDLGFYRVRGAPHGGDFLRLITCGRPGDG